MRITAGHMRGRVMRVPDIEGLRPTPSRVREALFNMLDDIHGSSVLDLFAGSGVIGLEALSRGAKSVTCIEGDRAACKAMKNIQESWQVDGWTIQAGKLPQDLPSSTYFDIVFADPPYNKGLAAQVPAWLKKNNVSYETLVVEEASQAKVDWKQGLSPVKQRKYSETTLYFFESNMEQI